MSGWGRRRWREKKQAEIVECGWIAGRGRGSSREVLFSFFFNGKINLNMFTSQ